MTENSPFTNAEIIFTSQSAFPLLKCEQEYSVHSRFNKAGPGMWKLHNGMDILLQEAVYTDSHMLVLPPKLSAHIWQNEISRIALFTVSTPYLVAECHRQLQIKCHKYIKKQGRMNFQYVLADEWITSKDN